METTWRKRFERAISLDGRSKRQISLAAGLGPNYVQQVLTDDKEPGIEKVIRVLSVLGSASVLYVISGIEFDERSEALLSALLALPPEARDKAAELFATLRVPEQS